MLFGALRAFHPPRPGNARRERENGWTATGQESAKDKAGTDRKVGPGGPDPRAHGTDKGEKGGGEGGGVPPDQQSEHP